jgi:hypothetical protein
MYIHLSQINTLIKMFWNSNNASINEPDYGI